MKILYVASVAGTMDFFTSIIPELIRRGNKVDVACNLKRTPIASIFRESGCRIFDLTCARSLSIKALRATIKEIKEIIKIGEYDIVHTHTPIASACARIACRKARKEGLKVIYTAHGFHFYKGAPIVNWLVYYPIEWLCSFMTDELITINDEDYRLAKKRFHYPKICLINGVGIDTKAFKRNQSDREKKRKEFGFSMNDTVLLSLGDLNENKNHITLISAVESINNKRVKLLVAGIGDKMEEYQSVISQKNLSETVFFLGFRTDVKELFSCADIYLHSSRREGLSVSAMEACASGLPIIASNVRGLRDIVDDGKGGLLCDPEKSDEFVEAIKKLAEDAELRKQFSDYNVKKAELYDYETINRQVIEIYDSIIIHKS